MARLVVPFRCKLIRTTKEIKNVSSLLLALQVYKIYFFHRPTTLLLFLSLILRYDIEGQKIGEGSVSFFFNNFKNSLNKGVKVYNKYQGPKITAPFHLLLVFKNLDDFKIWKFTSKCIETNKNLIFKYLEKYFGPLKCECLIMR